MNVLPKSAVPTEKKSSREFPAGPALCRNVSYYVFGSGSLARLEALLAERRAEDAGSVLFCVDAFFQHRDLMARLPVQACDRLHFVDASAHEPKTTDIDEVCLPLRRLQRPPCAVVGIGGGSTLDTAKAVSNLLTNEGRAQDYQGWDLVKNPGIFKIGVPTLSGTGAETSRTCVMTNPATGVKLGMNSEHSVFDRLILDPDLSRTAPRDQYFYTGVDTYLHCVESLRGRFRHPIADAFSEEALRLCREVFLGADMTSDESRAKLMTASYLGGCAIANSFVGVVHPFSAGLSVVLGERHGRGNCIAMTALEEFYPDEVREFCSMVQKQGVSVPRGLCRGLSPAQHEQLYRSTVVHEKPLGNALGEGFKEILTPEKVRELFLRM